MRRQLIAALALAGMGAVAAADDLGRASFADARHPPAWRAPGPLADAFELGQAAFNTQFVVSGTAGAARIDGLGPLFGNATCDACHNNGARGRGPVEPGELPGQLVVQLAGVGPDGGDPRYGQTLSPAAVAGVPVEGRVRVTFRAQSGRYPDGFRWERRAPRYEVEALGYGPLDPRTVLRPRMTPTVFGAGLLDAVPDAAIARGADPDDANGDGVAGRVASVRDAGGRIGTGRFGWMAAVVSLRQQTARAFLLEQGLTSADLPVDDCTAAQPACRAAPGGGSPEVSAELFDAVLAYESLLAVPLAEDAPANAAGAALFASAGCAACHAPALPVRLADGTAGTIHPYSDLLTHDLGAGLADRDMAGRAAVSRWRTAPLWGIGWQFREGRGLALLHDGRARSVEEAILWHEGEARRARAVFMAMGAADRAALAGWVLGR